MTAAVQVPTLEIDILVDSDLWKNAEKIKAIIRRAIARAAVVLSAKGTELAVVLTDDSAIRVLNCDWRGIDAATNVLSFPARNSDSLRSGAHLGDIVLAFETIAREARDEDKPLAHHLSHLVVHGFLHLLGYDHERDDDAELMERTERRILRQLAIPNPYRQRLRKRRTIKRTAQKRSGKAAAKPGRAGRKEPAKLVAKRPAAYPGQRAPRS